MVKVLKDLGTFRLVQTPEDFPPNIAFYENEKGQDWYKLLAHNPIPNTITLSMEGDRVIVANRDPSLINPINSRVLLIKDEGQNTRELSDMLLVKDQFVSPPAPPVEVKKFDILARMTEDEAEQFDSRLDSSMSRHMSMLYDAAFTFMSDSQLYKALSDYLSELFGDKRRQEIMGETNAE